MNVTVMSWISASIDIDSFASNSAMPNQHSSQIIALITLFWEFLKLGCTSFGGPAAHVVFFHQRFVKQLDWITEAQYAQLMGLAQMLPGPTSSQVGLSIGYLSRGYLGAIVAWLGFTLPSALFMAVIAITGSHFLSDDQVLFFHVVQLLVLAVVSWAFWQMMQSFCKTTWHYVLMLIATAIMCFVSHLANQFIVIGLGIVAGLFMGRLKQRDSLGSTFNSSVKTRSNTPTKTPQHFHALWRWGSVFVVVAIVLQLWSIQSNSVLAHSLNAFYQTGAMVFGGGHVVLPLLQNAFVAEGFVVSEQFDLGYATVQLMPGPLFSFASYLGAGLNLTPYVALNAALATLMIFLPSFFLMFALLPYWQWLASQQWIGRAIVGINAAVVGLLLSVILQMMPRYIVQISDVIFVLVVCFALWRKYPLVPTLLLSFVLYYAGLNFISA